MDLRLDQLPSLTYRTRRLLKPVDVALDLESLLAYLVSYFLGKWCFWGVQGFDGFDYCNSACCWFFLILNFDNLLRLFSSNLSIMGSKLFISNRILRVCFGNEL
jgi:uncharacterized membrane protein